MKRIAKRNITADMSIEFGQSNRVYNFAPRVLDKYGNIIGYIIESDFHQMTREGKLKKTFGDCWYAQYKLVVE